ncbi:MULTISPECIES: CopG family transcriptional regulator [Achromobacter]|uniref:ribbon-helix-helix domain-containing protein n=1 Tax=Achromobacter TaxID=222 RepID=UPI002F9148BD
MPEIMNRQAVNEKETQLKTRLSVSLPPELHQELERIARDKKVSLAWVMREAAEKYVASQWPLLTQSK